MASKAILLGLLCLIEAIEGFVIAPPWANPVINPCSEKSWQLIYWPQDGACYQIFEQGPCPNTQELAFHPTNKRVKFLSKRVVTNENVNYCFLNCRLFVVVPRTFYIGQRQTDVILNIAEVHVRPIST